MFKFILAFTLILLNSMSAYAQSKSIFNSVICKVEAKKVRDLILDSSRCENDNDCALEFFGCPFGCGSVINKANLMNIKKAIEHYNAQDCGVCRYRCQAMNLPVKLKCDKGSCMDLNMKGR